MFLIADKVEEGGWITGCECVTMSLFGGDLNKNKECLHWDIKPPSYGGAMGDAPLEMMV